MIPTKRSMLIGSCRFLDLSDYKGLLCGKILAHIGADVIKVERPGGDTARNIGPFYHDSPHPEKSLYWYAYNVNKRSVTLNIETSEGRDIFRRLVKTADGLIESFSPGHLDRLGLGYSALCEINPSLIMTSITPFGQTGPHRDYQGCDLIAMSLGGYAYLCGDTDRPPVRVGTSQAYLHAGADAAVATMIAHFQREMTGEGQHVDVSIQESITPLLFNAGAFWDINRVNLRRGGSFRVGISSGIVHQLVWLCKDGYVSFALIGGATGAPMNRALAYWMEIEGIACESWSRRDWPSVDMATLGQKEFDALAEPLGKLFLRHTKAELYEQAASRGIMMYPANDVRDILQDKQLRERHFWEEVDHPELGTALSYPGAFIRSNEVACERQRRAPLIGEHNREIYQEELQLPETALVALRQAGVI